MQFDIHTAACASRIEKIACSVPTISAEDDRFGTAARTRYIANSVEHGRTGIFPPAAMLWWAALPTRCAKASVHQ
jgi:hypothetical protein